MLVCNSPMKRFWIASAVCGFALVSCDTMSRPITSGDFDPMRAPGSGTRMDLKTPGGFKAGQFVRAVMDNTAFFSKQPKGEADADKLLTKGTSMKVVSVSDSYVKVELDGSGEVGWVHSIQVEDPNAPADGTVTNPGEYQLYPPVGSGGAGAPLPLPDPAGMPPEGAIPTVIDPDAPANGTPVPKLNPPKESFEAPPAEPSGKPAEPAKSDADKKKS